MKEAARLLETILLWNEQTADDESYVCEPEFPEQVNMHPNQLDGLGCSDPTDALIELIDLKHGFMEV